MFIVTSGTIPPNPTELLTTVDMSEFSKNLHDLVDIIIYDTPPVTSVADSLILAQAAKNVVLMIKMGATSKKMTRSVVKQLKELDIKVVGAVLNEVDFKKELYYGRYGKYGKYYRYYKRYYKYDYYHKEPEAGRKA
jgi:capsular exopolysaccharide synthesis family protein